jgi:hypothetical protein
MKVNRITVLDTHDVYGASEYVTYDLHNGRFVSFRRDLVQQYGLTAMLEAENIEVTNKDRVPVVQYGRRVGTVPWDFSPATARSLSFMYDVRPHDLMREGDVWVVDKSLGAQDLDCLAGFRRDT